MMPDEEEEKPYLSYFPPKVKKEKKEKKAKKDKRSSSSNAIISPAISISSLSPRSPNIVSINPFPSNTQNPNVNQIITGRRGKDEEELDPESHSRPSSLSPSTSPTSPRSASTSPRTSTSPPTATKQNQADTLSPQQNANISSTTSTPVNPKASSFQQSYISLNNDFPSAHHFTNVYNNLSSESPTSSTPSSNRSDVSSTPSSTTTPPSASSTSTTSSSSSNNRFGVHGLRLHAEFDDNSLFQEEGGIIELNVGGKNFATTLETLRKDPNSMLHAMFSGLYKSKKDKNGRFFIDRDGKLFRHILNYLRDGTLDLDFESHSMSFLKTLLREAQFYNLDGLVSLIEDIIESHNMKQDADKTGQYAVVYLGGYGKSAQIYTKDTGGGFSESCVTLNKLATEGYHIEGVASGANGHYYAICRTNEPDKNIFKKKET